MKFEEALENYTNGYKSRPLAAKTECEYDGFLSVILTRMEELKDENGRLHNIDLADMIIEARTEAERKNLNRLFTYGIDVDEPELAAVRHVEMALIDSYAERNLI